MRFWFEDCLTPDAEGGCDSAIPASVTDAVFMSVNRRDCADPACTTYDNPGGLQEMSVGQTITASLAFNGVDLGAAGNAFIRCNPVDNPQNVYNAPGTDFANVECTQGQGGVCTNWRVFGNDSNGDEVPDRLACRVIVKTGKGRSVTYENLGHFNLNFELLLELQ